MRGPASYPPLAPAPIPSAFDPHTVARAWFMASRWMRHCTNDPDAMGRVCSALPGSEVVGMGAHSARHVPAGTRVRRPSHPGV